MIIVCPECSTKFNVASERIPDRGAKVRCARCKHVFLAEKPREQKPQESTIESFAIAPDAEKTSGEPGAEESGFSYDKFQELDSSTTEEANFTFGAESETENENFFYDKQDSGTAPDGTPEESFTFSEADESVSPIEKAFNATEENKNKEAAASAFDDEDVTNAFAVEAKQPDETEYPTQPVRKKKSSPLSGIIRALLLLILGILIVGGVLVYMNGPEQLNQTIQQLLGQYTDRPVQTGQITLTQLEGKFIQNEQAGELFLIRGKAINNYSESRSAIQVKGVIFDQNGNPLLQKTVFCGNPINDADLQTFEFSELEKIMGNQFGKDLSNMKIGSKQSIPFDIVFKDLPKSLSEFSVIVTSSKPATK